MGGTVVSGTGNTVHDQQLAVSPLGTDELLGWQSAQTPPSRKFTLDQIVGVYNFAPLTPPQKGAIMVLPQVDGNRLEIDRDSAALNYDGTRAAFVVQQRDAEDLAADAQVPSFVLQATSTGNGVVTVGPNLSRGFWLGLQVNMTKSGDGSGQAITPIGNLGVIGTTGYNELSLYAGSAFNAGSTNGYMSLFEAIASDGTAGTHYDTKMFGIVPRIARYNAGSKSVVAIAPSSEGTQRPDWILKTVLGGAGDNWKGGFDLSTTDLSTGIAFQIPNNSNFSSVNGAGNASVPFIGTTTTNITFIRPLSNAAYVELEDFQGIPTFRALNYGGVSAVNWLTAMNAASGGNPVLGTANAAGSGAIPMVLAPQGGAAVLFTTLVGIGTAVPDYALTIQTGSNNLGNIHLINDNSTTATPLLSQVYAASATTGAQIIGNFSRGTAASPAAVHVGDRLGSLAIGGWTGSAFANTAAILAAVDTGTVSATSLPTYIAFQTTPDGSLTRVERGRFSKAGYFGLGGNTTPAYAMDATGDANVSGVYRVAGTQVMGARITGWGASTNGSRGAVDGSTATLAQTRAALAQLLVDLTTQGVLGA